MTKTTPKKPSLPQTGGTFTRTPKGDLTREGGTKSDAETTATAETQKGDDK